ncbi:MAG: MarR family transcriptional regulator, partial [Pseudomonadota bacterium]
QDHPFYTPRFTPVMKALAADEPLSIKAIAERSSVSHSAASQTVAKLARHGLVELDQDTDRRGRLVSLTKDGRALLPWLQRRWAATNKAADALDQELTHPLSAVLAEAIEQLEQCGFAQRIKDHEKHLGEAQ